MIDREATTPEDVTGDFVFRNSFRHYRTGRIIYARPGKPFKIPVRGNKPKDGK